METRKERYAKYRSDIKTRSADGFVVNSVPPIQEETRLSPSPSNSSQSEEKPVKPTRPMPEKKAPASPKAPRVDDPYQGYVRNRRRALWIKLAVSGVIIAAFVVWLILLLVRSA